MSELNPPAPISELGLYDQVVWNDNKTKLSDTERFMCLQTAAVIEFLRQQKRIDVYGITANELITLFLK